MSDAKDAVERKLDTSQLQLRAKPRPVMRLNRRTLVIGATLLAIVLFAATFWSLGTTKRASNSDSQPQPRPTENTAKAEGIDKLPKDYASAPKLGEPQPGDWGRLKTPAQEPVDARGTPPSVDSTPRQEIAAANQSADQIAKAPIFFSVAKRDTDKRSESPSTSSPALNIPNQITVGTTPPTDPTMAQNGQERKTAFLDQTGEAATRNAGSLMPPPSPYVVMAGTTIAAALVTGINSDLPGQIIASVTEPVYDSASGRSLLIPQGSRLLGRYDSQIAFGQRRVLVVWTRLVLPDTSSITLDRLSGVDAAGYAGLEDGVDWHWDRVFAGAAVSTLIGVGAELAAPNRDSGDGRVVIATRDSVQDSINQVGQEITKRNLNIQPTLTERPGLPVRVIINKDLILKPYQPLFYTRSTE